MILLIAGTSEGRELAEALGKAGFNLLVTTVTDYGALLAEGCSPEDLEEPEIGYREVIAKALTSEELRELIIGRNIKVIIDASHPYARIISEMAIRVAAEKRVRYLRYEREKAEIIENSLVHKVYSYQEAASIAATLGDNIFLTTGTRGLEEIIKSPQLYGKRVVARILPEVDGLKKCRELGILPRDIVALQGPFTEEFNIAIFRAYDASVIITKESGARGGTETKVKAALSLRIPVVIIERPEINYPTVVFSINDVLTYLIERIDFDDRYCNFGSWQQS